MTLVKRRPLPRLKRHSRAAAKPPSDCVIGASHASAIGDARFRSFIAHHVARCRFPRPICQSPYPKMLIFQPPATRLPIIQAGNIQNARNVAVPPSVNKIPLIHFLKVHGIFCVMLTRRIKMGSAPRRRPIGCRLTNISAGLSMRCCICSIHGFLPAH